MKRLLIVILSLAVFAFVLNAAEMKIGYVDIEKVFNKYEGTKDAKDKLQKKLEKEQKNIEKKKEEILADKNDLDKKRSILDASKVKAKEADLQEKLEKLQAEAMEIQQKLLTEEKELTADIVEQIRGIVTALAKEKGFTMVFEKNLLLYGGEDITYLVIKKINEE